MIFQASHDAQGGWVGAGPGGLAGPELEADSVKAPRKPAVGPPPPHSIFSDSDFLSSYKHIKNYTPNGGHGCSEGPLLPHAPLLDGSF